MRLRRSPSASRIPSAFGTWLRRALSPVDMVLLTILVGWIGLWLEMRPEGLTDHIKVVYGTMGLFYTDNQNLLGRNLLLSVAVMVAPLVTMRVAFSVTRSLWIGRLDNWRASRASGHEVVVGTGPNGRAVARGLRAEGRVVVAVEADALAPGIDGLRADGVRVLLGDATDTRTLKTAQVHVASRAWVFTGHDESAIQVLEALRAVNVSRTAATLRAFINLENPRLSEQLREHELRMADESLEVVLVTVADICADMAMRAAGGLSAGRNLVVLGDLPFAKAVAQVAKRYSQADMELGRAHFYCLASQISEVDRFDLDSNFAKWDDLARLRGLGDEQLRQELVGSDETQVPDAILVSFSDNALTREWALRLARLADALELSQVAVLREAPSLEKTFECLVGSKTRILDMAGELGKQVVVPHSGWTEDLAQALHARYLSKGYGGRASVPWPKLEEHYKDANRSQARGIPLLLEQVDCLVEVTHGSVVPFVPTDEELQVMAEAEHERWMAERRRNWHRLDKELRAKAESRMKPFAELDHGERLKDSEAIIEALAVLAKMGYQVKRRRDIA